MDLPVTLQSDEQVVELLHRHPVRVIMEVIISVLLAIILIAILSFLSSLLPILSVVWNILIAIVVVVGLVYVLFSYYRYRNDIWLITTQRIIDSAKRTPFNHDVSSADLINVQDISVSRNGILQTAFNYGDVKCQTASGTQVFTFIGVPNPNHVLEIIDETRDKARKQA